MSLGAILYERLTGDTAVAAMVGTRVYPVLLPQAATLPAVTYQIISAPSGEGSLRMDTVRVQVDCWADHAEGAGYDQAHTLADAVRDALDGFGDRDQATVVVSGRQIDRREDYEPETKQFRVMCDFYLWVTEGVGNG